MSGFVNGNGGSLTLMCICFFLGWWNTLRKDTHFIYVGTEVYFQRQEEKTPFTYNNQVANDMTRALEKKNMTRWYNFNSITWLENGSPSRITSRCRVLCWFTDRIILPELADSRHKAYRKNVIYMIRLEFIFPKGVIGRFYAHFMKLGENMAFLFLCVHDETECIFWLTKHFYFF